MIVVDCAAVVDALTGLGGTDELRARLAEEELHTSALLDFEVVSAFRGLIRGAHISASRATDALTDLDDLAIQRWPPTDGMRRRVLHLRDTMSPYDAAYVVLAEALECPLLTRDRRLAGSAGRLVSVVIR